VHPILCREAPFDTSEDRVSAIRKDSTLNFDGIASLWTNAIPDLGGFHSAERAGWFEANKRQSPEAVENKLLKEVARPGLPTFWFVAHNSKI
jgi:hypothetical protein